MLRRPNPVILAALMVVASACDDQTPVGPMAETAPTFLDLRIPRITNDDLVESRVIELGPRSMDDMAPTTPTAADRQARVSGDGSWNAPAPQIFQARTSAGFYDGFAYTQATHRYSTNVGRIETTVNVDYMAEHLGSQTAETQQYNPFLLNFAEFVKSIWATARVYSDKACGLSVQGSSRHSARWQFFLAGPAPSWGEAIETSQAAPVSQDACVATGSGTSARQGAGGAVCYYYIVYELATGRILSADLLFCNSPGGDLA